MKQPTLFGTDGIRGCAGEGILTPINLIRLGHAIGTWALDKYGSGQEIVMLCDTRISASIIKAALKIGLLECSLNVIDCGTLPTPAALVLMQYLDSGQIALVISASHNQYHDNGIKIVDRTQGKVQPIDEEIISNYFSTPPRHTKGWGVDRPFSRNEEIYCEHIASQFSAQFAHGVRVVLDSGHGALSRIAHKVFTQCGAAVIDIHCQPSGYNINEGSGSNHPQTLVHAVKEHCADIGFAFDGDGDRLIAVNKYGIIKDGDDILCILRTHPRYCKLSSIIGTVMTNEGLDQHLASCGIQLIRTPVGDRHIMHALAEKNLMLGGESSGHIILHDKSLLGDALFNALTLLETIIFTKNWDLDSFVHYPQVMQNIPIQHRHNLNDEPFHSCIKHYEQMLTAGRILVRYSGTENVMRIMVEAMTHTEAQKMLDALTINMVQLMMGHHRKDSLGTSYEL